MEWLAVPSLDEVAGLSAAEVEQLLQGLDARRRLVESETALLLARVEAVGAHRVDGHRTPRAFGVAACNWSSADGLRLVQAAHVLAVFPTAFGLGVSQLHALAGVVANPRVRPFLPEAEELLVGQAHVLTFDEYVVFLAHWVATVDPDGSAVAHERAHRERTARVSLVGERGVVQVSCGSADAAFYAEVLAAYADSEFLADWEVAAAEHDVVDASKLARNPRQRNADAVKAIFVAAAEARRTEGAGAVEPEVLIVIDQATFEQQLVASAGGEPGPAPDPTAVICRTASGVELDPRDALVAALVGHVRRVVVNSAGVVVNMGRRQRLFTGPLRAAILALHPGCTRDGCNCRGREVDHLVPWARGGLTDAANGGPACGHHNRWGTLGYRTVRDADGHWHHYRPDGTEIGWRNGRLTRLMPPLRAAA